MSSITSTKRTTLPPLFTKFGQSNLENRQRPSFGGATSSPRRDWLIPEVWNGWRSRPLSCRNSRLRSAIFRRKRRNQSPSRPKIKSHELTEPPFVFLVVYGPFIRVHIYRQRDGGRIQ